MIKTIYQLFGIKICEIICYEDEKEMPVKSEAGGEALVLNEKEIKKLEE